MAVGPQLTPDGSTPSSGRQGKTGEASVAQVHGKYFEAASRGVLAFACDQGAGVAPGTTLSTTAMLSLFNPLASKFRIAIKKVSIGYISGTLGAGTLYHCVSPLVSGTAPTQPSSGTALTSYWTDIMNPQLGSPIGLARTGSTVVAPIAYRPCCTFNAVLATTATLCNAVIDDLDGEIILEPGGCYQLQAVAASGSTPKLGVGILWEEVPFVQQVG